MIYISVFNKTIIPLALVGYEMIIANSALRASLAIYYLISNARSWNMLNIPALPNMVKEHSSKYTVLRLREKMADKSRFGSELTEAEVNALVDNATPSNTKKVTKFGTKIFNGTYLIFLMPM